MSQLLDSVLDAARREDIARSDALLYSRADVLRALREPSETIVRREAEIRELQLEVSSLKRRLAQFDPAPCKPGLTRVDIQVEGVDLVVDGEYTAYADEDDHGRAYVTTNFEPVVVWLNGVDVTGFGLADDGVLNELGCASMAAQQAEQREQDAASLAERRALDRAEAA